MFWEVGLFPWESGSPVTAELSLFNLNVWEKTNLEQQAAKYLHGFIYLFFYMSETGLHFHSCRLFLLFQNRSFNRKVNSSLSCSSLPHFLGKRDL